MSEKPQHTIKIWFFVGILFVAYGILILAAGLFMETPKEVKMQHLNLQIWWGILLLVVGSFFSIRFRPGRE